MTGAGRALYGGGFGEMGFKVGAVWLKVGWVGLPHMPIWCLPGKFHEESGSEIGSWDKQIKITRLEESGAKINFKDQIGNLLKLMGGIV